MLELLLAILAGVALGVFTGLLPGIHINLVAAMMLSIAPALLRLFSPMSVAAAIIAMSITHVFLDFIPSIFLGSPSDATALAVLPGHRLLLKGRGYEAVFLLIIGALLAILLVIALLPALLLSVKGTFRFLSPHIGMLLLLLMLRNVWTGQGQGMLWTAIVAAFAGLLGIFALQIPNLSQPLLPLLSGLFGVSTLLASYLQQSYLPIQTTDANLIEKKKIAKSVAAGTFSGMLMGIFPALGPAQAAMLAHTLLGKVEERAYLLSIGAVSASSMLFGLVTLYTIDKARNGSIAIMSQIIDVKIAEFFMLTLAAVASCGIAAIVALFAAKLFARKIYLVDYTKLSIAILLFITAIVALFSGATGLVILATGAAIGLLSIIKNIPRHNLMSCLMVPVMLYYF